MKLFSKYSSLCDHRTVVPQRHRLTDGHLGWKRGSRKRDVAPDRRALRSIAQ